MTRRLLAVSVLIAAIVVVWPADAFAQRGGGHGGGHGGGIRGPIIGGTIVYPPIYGPYGYGYPYQYPYPYPYERGYRYDDSASVRIEVKPRETEVYVDGARAGIVDDYDGIFQRLHVTPGEHMITLYLAGYRSWSEVRYFSPNSDQRILHTMLPLAPGQPDDPRPTPMRRSDPRDFNDPGGEPRRPADRPLREPPPPSEPRQPARPGEPTQPAPPPQPPRPAEPPQPMSPNAPRNSGTLSVGIEPGDAEITLDGQRQTLRSRENRLVIQLEEGVHRLVIQKSGYQTFETDLQIRRGRTLAFNVSLVK